MQKGYQVIEFFEVFEYDVTQYDSNTSEGGLFVEYINTFLKLKAEASGYPNWVRNPEDKGRYIHILMPAKASCSIRKLQDPMRRNEHQPNCV